MRCTLIIHFCSKGNTSISIAVLIFIVLHLLLPSISSERFPNHLINTYFIALKGNNLNSLSNCCFKSIKHLVERAIADTVITQVQNR